MAYNEFRSSGIPDYRNTASATSASTMVAAVSGKRIVVYDILASAATTLTDGSTTIINVPAGSSNLTAGIEFGVGKAVVLGGTSNVTITYAILN